MSTVEIKVIPNLYIPLLRCDACGGAIPEDFPFVNVCGDVQDEDHPNRPMGIVDHGICVDCVGEAKDTLDQMVGAIAFGACKNGIEKKEQTGNAIKP